MTTRQPEPKAAWDFYYFGGGLAGLVRKVISLIRKTGSATASFSPDQNSIPPIAPAGKTFSLQAGAHFPWADPKLRVVLAHATWVLVPIQYAQTGKNKVGL